MLQMLNISKVVNRPLYIKLAVLNPCNFAIRPIFITLLIIFILGCSGSRKKVYEGSEDDTKKIQILLDISGVSAESRIESGGRFSLFVSSSYYEEVSSALAQLDLILSMGCQADKGVRDYFLPNLGAGIKFKDNALADSYIDVLKKVPGIISVSCLGLESTSGEENVKFTVWYLNSWVPLEEIQDTINNMNNIFEIKSPGQFVFREIPWKSARVKQLSDSSVKLIVFEPFSFRVLDREKSIASFQFLIMLSLFLISGFALGFWWGKR
ncbi:MAG TPA: hypothetical protein PKA63_00310 [Oligoflexia bacterium]|nr:hypothetical protein [Oligoflexia bacterium]HMP47091.1 hypothetical protein [Oligoflexia bacterium]